MFRTATQRSHPAQIAPGEAINGNHNETHEWDNELIERAGGVTPSDWCSRKSK